MPDQQSWITLKDDGWSEYKEYGEERTTRVIFFHVDLSGNNIGSYMLQGPKGGHVWRLYEVDRRGSTGECLGTFKYLRMVRDHFYYQGEVNFSVPRYKEPEPGIYREGRVLDY